MTTAIRPTVPPATGRNDGYNPMPLWASIPLLLLCLVGGGYILHWYVHTGALTKDTSILGLLPPDGFNRSVSGSGSSWSARTELADVDFHVDKGKSSVTKAEYRAIGGVRRGGTRFPGFIPDAVRRQLEGASAVAQGTPLGVTKPSADVVQQIRGQIIGVNFLTLTADEHQKAKILAEFDAYRLLAEAGGPGKKPVETPELIQAESKLLAAIDDVASSLEDQQKQEAQRRADAIVKLLTPEQAAALPTITGRGGRRNP